MFQPVTKLILAGALLLATQQVNATDASLKCHDKTGIYSTAFFKDLMRATNSCHAAKAGGLVSKSCRLQDAQHNLDTDPKFLSDYKLAFSQFDMLINKACANPLPTNFKYPCSTEYGTVYVSDLRSCINTYAHGLAARRLQNLLHKSTAVINDTNVRSCKAAVAGYVAGYAEAVMKARRKCGKPLLFGKECNVEGYLSDIEKARAKFEGGISSRCKDADIAQISFSASAGDYCSGQYASVADASRCLLDAAEVASEEASDIIYSLPN